MFEIILLFLGKFVPRSHVGVLPRISNPYSKKASSSTDSRGREVKQICTVLFIYTHQNVYSVYRDEEQETPILQPRLFETDMVMQRNDTYKITLSKDHNYLLSALCISFGMATWLPVNAIYTQMPLLTQFAPEGWTLPSYFSVLVQIANVAPIFYFFVKDRKCCPDSVLICFFLVLGTLSLFFLAFTYYIPISVLGSPHSFFFFLFSFFLSLVGCISSVLFLPFMGRLPEVYLVSYFIGEGFSGFVPSLLAMLQGVAKDPVCMNVTESGNVTAKMVYEKPLFSSTLFLIIISGLMLFNTLCFLYLNYFSNLMSKYASKPKETPNSDVNRDARVDEPENGKIPRVTLVLLLSVQGIINCFSNGILPSIMSYSCLPYGAQTYHWSVNIHQIIGPLSSYFAFFIPLVSIRLLTVCCIVEVLCVNYELITALTSPLPPLVGTNAGVATIVSG